jgi:hypothetical protein
MDQNSNIQAVVDCQINHRIPYKMLVTILVENNYLGRSHSDQVKIVQSKILDLFQIVSEDLPPQVENQLKVKICTFISKLRKRNRKQSHHINRVVNEPWCNADLILPEEVITLLLQRNQQEVEPMPIAVDCVEENLDHCPSTMDSPNHESSDDVNSDWNPFNKNASGLGQSNKPNMGGGSARAGQSAEDVVKEKKKRSGRKPKPFDLKRPRAQLALAQEIRKKYPHGAIKLAFEQGLKQEGRVNSQKKDIAYILKKCGSATGLTASIAKKAVVLKKTVIKKTSEQALFFILANGLSKQQYICLKKSSRESGYDIWPNYDYVREAKNNLRPEGIAFQPGGAIVVPLQDLLEKTISRTLQDNSTLFDNILDLADEKGGDITLTLFFKYGFDSSGAHEVAQQPNAAGDHRTVKHLMSSQLVPLQLAFEESSGLQSLYNFPSPNSPHACRPIRLAYEKENDESILREFNRLKTELSNLEDYTVHSEPRVRIHFYGLLTLVDGKVVSLITRINSSRCSLCGKGRKDLRRKECTFDPIFENLQFGCSILHFGIRVFETLLKIGYKKEMKQFTAQEARVDSIGFKEKVDKGKELVQKRFKDEQGLIVDKARTGGLGSTNTGNVARRAFSAPVSTADICGVSVLLVSNLETIWKTLASGY